MKAATTIDIPAKPLKSRRLASAMQILRIPALRDRVLPGPVEFNEMLQCPTIDRVPVEDHHVTQLRERIELHLRDAKDNPIEFSKEIVHDALHAVARESPFHPVAEYLESLRWDGLPRLGRMIGEVLHAPRERIYHRVVWCWMISAVARVLEPGCKADGVLILQGPQGIGKSTFFSVLAGEWFSDSPIDMGRHADAALACSRAWILELAELAAINKRDLETNKAFLTQCVDDFRPPYGRHMVRLPRRCVFAGTANPREILVDPTGNRRFWVVPVTGVDLYQLRIWRDQLWAEAVELYRQGEPWHLDEIDEAELAESQREFEAEDPWTEAVLAFVDRRVNPPTTAEILADGLQLPAAQITRAAEMRVAAILRKAGWEKAREWTEDGKRAHRWRKLR